MYYHLSIAFSVFYFLFFLIGGLWRLYSVFLMTKADQIDSINFDNLLWVLNKKPFTLNECCLPSVIHATSTSIDHNVV